jgi:UPF0755 protein
MTEPTEHPLSETIVISKKSKTNWFWKLLKYSMILIALCVSIFIFIFYQLNELNEPPPNFPSNQPVTIQQGSDIRTITSTMEEVGVIKSKEILYYSLVLFHDPSTIKASTYIFEEPITTLEVAKKLTEGDFDTDLIRLTHFEGERVSKLAERAAEVLPDFSADKFIELAEPLEGKLFPETYFIPDSFTHEDLLKLLTDTFDTEIEKRSEQIQSHSLSLDEIVILASIIEREANTEESKKIVSSVLQNRIEIGMALQADASIEYILDKPLSELTPEDLKIDSQYNTYLYRDLPPTPIGNPGAEAIDAVLNPTESEYFYYITDNDGVFHYAETYRQHLINIEKFLR